MAKCALVTGAARGIGACIAETLAERGFNIALNCRMTPEGEANAARVAEKCRALGARADCFPADVSDFGACGELAKNVLEAFDSIDILVNNAGITKDGLLVRMGEEQFDSVISVNLKSVFNMMHHVGRIMMKAKSGRIINISSVAGLYGNPGQANYSAAKAGIVGMTMTAAKELGPRGITVNAVAPGFIETGMTAGLPEELIKKAIGNIALGRLGNPRDVAGAVAFLAGEDASFITGQVLVVDGGMLI